MKRTISILLILLLLASLLPSAFADNGIYVTVGSSVFSAVGQTLSVGGGTATLRWNGRDPHLELTNVTLSKFWDVGEGILAAISYAGTRPLELDCVNCRITAPARSGGNEYYGILGEGEIILSGDLSIENVDCGILADSFTGKGAVLSVSSLEGPALAGDSILLESGSYTLSSKGSTVVFGNKVNSQADLTVTHHPDTASYGCTDIVSVLATQRVTLSTTTRIELNADLSAYSGVSDILCCAVHSDDEFYQNGPIFIDLTLRGNKHVAAAGIDADDLVFCTNGRTTCRLSLSGGHAAAYCLCGNTVNDTASFYNYPQLECSMVGAKAGDVAFLFAGSSSGHPLFGEIYCTVDDPNALCLLFGGHQFIDGYANGSYCEPINIHYPKNGGYAEINLGGDSVRTIVDADGTPATTVVLSNRDYPFRDIDAQSQAPFKPAILWAVDLGITTGFTPVEFRPTSACTRAQVVTFLWRAKGSPEPKSTVNPFADVKSVSPYYKAILWAFDNGITTGFDASHFAPNEPCTRAQVVTFLWRAEGKPASVGRNPFTDVSKSGSTAPYYNAILWASEAGITGGYGNNDFRPNVTCTRAQIVTFLYRDMYERYVNQRGAPVSVELDSNPTELSDTVIDIANNPYYNSVSIHYYGKRWWFEPVNITIAYQDGSTELLTLNMPCYDEYRSGDVPRTYEVDEETGAFIGKDIQDPQPLPESRAECLLIDGERIYLGCTLDLGSDARYILVLNTKDYKAKFVSTGMYAECYRSYERMGDLLVLNNFGSYTFYSISRDELRALGLRGSGDTQSIRKDVKVIGDTIYAVKRDYAFFYEKDGQTFEAYNYTVYRTDFDGIGRNMTELGTYRRCTDLNFDDTGYTVTYFGEDADDETFSMHYRY